MIHLPAVVRDRIERCVAGVEGPNFGIDDEARMHGAIALMGSLGAIWGLRPDGTFWEFDEGCEVPLTVLPEEREVLALAYGAERHLWLAPLLPIRPSIASDCTFCNGNRRFSVAVGYAMCPECSGLGWFA